MGAIIGHHRRVSKPFNIFIGNATDINTAQDLDLRISNNPNNISKFKKVGDDVFARIEGSYEFTVNSNIQSPWTTYEDREGLVDNISTNAFRQMPNLIGDLTFDGVINQNGSNPFRFTQNTELGNLYLPNCTNMISTSFLRECSFKEFHAVNLISLTGLFFALGATQLTLVNIPNCVQIGTDPTVYEQVFIDITLGCTINVPIIHATSNNGGIDADLTYAINTRNCIVNFI